MLFGKRLVSGCLGELLRSAGFDETGGTGLAFPPIASYLCTMSDIEVRLAPALGFDSSVGGERPGDKGPSEMEFDIGKMNIDCGRDRSDAGDCAEPVEGGPL